jgi:hypothetical protein
MISQVPMESALNSLSVVNRTISDFNLLAHELGQPQNVMTYPVQEKTLSQIWLNSLCHQPTKWASTNMSNVKDILGCKL